MGSSDETSYLNKVNSILISVLIMLERPGDLIPVQPNATSIPWTRRRSQILNFLHRGPVTFNTLVYDTNVGDISALATYFNPDRISERELNLRFGHYPTSGEKHDSPRKIVGNDSVVKPRLLLYPNHSLDSSQVKLQRTLNWVLSQDASESPNLGQVTPPEFHPSTGQHIQAGLMGLRMPSEEIDSKQIKPEPEDTTVNQVEPLSNLLDLSHPPSSSKQPCLEASKSFTLPTISLTSALDSVWAERGVGAVDTQDSVWAEKGVDSGLGLGGLIGNVSGSVGVLDRLEGAERWYGAWDTAHTW